MFQLSWQSRADEPVPLVSGELVLVGRGENCGVRIDDPSASRIHCRLLARDGKVFLTDAGSRWGTFVNGQRVADCELRPGDVITIGETVLRLDATATPDATTIARRSELERRSEMPPRWPSLAAIAAGPALQSPQLVSREERGMQHGDEAVVVRQLTPGMCFAGFQIRERLARTTSGDVFLATSVAALQDVALKVFNPDAVRDEVARQRFVRALELMRGLQHPHLVTLLDAGIEQGRCFVVSEFIDGENAAALIQRIGVVGMLDWRTTLRIGRDICEALVFASEQGIVHRHISPQNILIRKSDGTALLNDLRLARSLEDDAGPRLTQPGELLGTLPFLSPEQVGSGQSVDERSDLYQLGATLYALLTGHPPAVGRNPAEVVQQILNDVPAAPTRTHLAVPALLEGVILRLLEKRPDDRYASAVTLQKELQRISRYLGELSDSH